MLFSSDLSMECMGISMNKTPYKDLFAGHIDLSFKTAASMLAAYPASASAFLRLSKGLKAAECSRKKLAAEGVEVPALMIVSTTDACNLACAGCYACAQSRKPADALTDERIAEILDEASGLGVSVVMLAGGEPLLSHGWLDAMSNHPEMAGIVFTNGTLFDERRLAWFAAHRHIIPTLSIEGGEAQTDARRGSGVYAKVTKTMAELRADRIPFGISVTVTSRNIDSILTDDFTQEYIQKGCRLFLFVEYVPVEAGSEPMVLSKADKKRLRDFTVASEARYPALFIPFPGDEEQFGGCLAAGRGFVHVSAGGDVEPCPFAPFSDTNLKQVSLKEALTSGFLSRIRENHHLLKEGDGGCALWNNRAWLETIR
ncbi:MAG: radical SAM protein [Oscillospiraceae bacterium]